MKFNLKTIKEAYDQVTLHKNDLRLSNLADEIEGFERELRGKLGRERFKEKRYCPTWDDGYDYAIREVLDE